MGLTDKSIPSRFQEVYKNMWLQNGDQISKLYSGTGALDSGIKGTVSFRFTSDLISDEKVQSCILSYFHSSYLLDNRAGFFKTITVVSYMRDTTEFLVVLFVRCRYQCIVRMKNKVNVLLNSQCSFFAFSQL